MRKWLVPLAVLLLAAFLRLHWLNAQSFWNDEGNSARLSERSVQLILEGTASDVHPPLYYLILRGWRALAGASEFALRSVSALAGVLVTALTVPLGRCVLPARAGAWPLWLAAGLVAVNPAHVYYSQEARMYTLLPLWALLGTVLLGRLLRGGGRRTASAYAVVLAAGLYTHYFFPAVVAAHGALALGQGALTRRALWARCRRFLPPVFLALLLYLPWLPVALRPLGGNRGVAQPFAAFADGALTFLVFGRTLPPTPLLTLVAAAVLLPALVAVAAAPRRALPAALLVAVPVGALAALGATDAEFYKFLLLAVPPLWLLAVGGAVHLAHALRAVAPAPRLAAGVALAAALALAVGVLPATARSLTNLYTDPAYARDDYRGIARRIAAENRPNAAVILNAPNQWEVFTYYHRDGAPVYPLPRGGADAAAVAAALTAVTADHDHLYALFWGDRLQDPQGLVEQWLNDHTYRTGEEWVGDVRLVQFAVPSAESATVDHPLDLPAGDAILLHGYTLAADRPRPGDVVELTLFWQARQPVATRYKVFVHLVDAAGTLIAQRDAEPRGGLAPTPSWAVGAVVSDRYGLVIPPATPPGDYTLLVGLYDIADPTRRLWLGSAESAVDAYPVATVTVSEE